MIGENILTVADSAVTLAGPYADNFTRTEQHPPTSNLVYFTAASQQLWVSLSPRGPAFIKFGYGYRMERNLLYTFTSHDHHETGLDAAIRDVESVQIDDVVQLVEAARSEADTLMLDPSPFLILPELRTRDHDLYSDGVFYMPIAHLPAVAAGLLEQVCIMHARYYEPETLLS